MRRDVTVFREEGVFAAWPAGGFCRSWGNEILVAFSTAVHQDKPRGHTFDRESKTGITLARSLDGGLSWSPENSPIADPAPGNSKHPEMLKDFTGNIDFTDGDLVLCFAMSGTRKDDFSWWFYSPDRGHSWNGPFRIPQMEGFSAALNMRTQYIVENLDEILVFGTCQRSNGTEGRTFCARMSQGGRKMEFLSYVGDELPVTDECYEIMPQARRRKDGSIVCITRRFDSRNRFHYFTLSQYISRDNGRSFEFDGYAAEHYGGNPGSLEILGDGTWVLVYGYRRKPYGIRLRYSEDEGRNWSREIILRDDGGCGDLGYPRSALRADGSEVVCYYFNTGRKDMRHIQASIFDSGFLREAAAAGSDDEQVIQFAETRPKELI